MAEVSPPLTLDETIERTGVDIAFLAMAAKEMDLAKAPGVHFLADALLESPPLPECP